MKESFCEECDNNHATPYERSLPHFSLRDEVLKLLLIVQGSEGPIYPSDLAEKLEAILRELPISLDAGKQVQFNMAKSDPATAGSG